MNIKKRLPIGKSDFESVISGNFYYVDKTLFIVQLMERGAEVTLFPRPRRFGKTLNLTMLKAFFEKSETSKRHLFDGLAVSKLPEVMAEQGKYPVIFMTLKDVKQEKWAECFYQIKKIVGEEFERHSYLLSSSFLSAGQKKEFQDVIDKVAPEDVYQNALKDLSKYLHAYHQQKVIVLIDEYDTVIHEAYLKNFYKNAIGFMRTFLGGGLKDSTVLHQGIVTGILRVAKESIFSGLNNLLVSSFFREDFADTFGLTEAEVAQMLKDYDCVDKSDQVREWYNGYTIGSVRLYNPWSLINLVHNRCIFEPYWVNTSQADMIQDLVYTSYPEARHDLERLLNGESVEQVVDDTVVFDDLKVITTAFWSFLLYTGYLTFRRHWMVDTERHVELVIPNKEIGGVYKTTVRRWFARSADVARQYLAVLQDLTNGNVDGFKQLFTSFVEQSISMFDVKGPEPENFYHALVLGMLVSLQNTHEVRSNRESGYGRYDVMIIPKNVALPGTVIEFKKIDPSSPETLEDAAQAALKQIRDRHYVTELHARGISKVIELAIVFRGKQVLVKAAE